jgi:hypothetical protein
VLLPLPLVLHFQLDQRYYLWLFCHFLLAQKVTQKGTTNTNRLLDLGAPSYATSQSIRRFAQFVDEPRAGGFILAATGRISVLRCSREIKSALIG